MVPTSYELDDHFINIAFFGSVYENRNLCFIKQIISLEKKLKLKKEVKFHLFIPTWADLSEIFTIEEYKKIIRNDYVSYFEFLNIAKKMNYLILNDVSFPKEKINPYLPSKFSDYLATGTKILAFVQEGSVLSQSCNSTLKIIKNEKDLIESIRDEA